MYLYSTSNLYHIISVSYNKAGSCYVKDKRFYQGYVISDADHESMQSEIKVDGIPMRLVDFSLGGLCFHSKEPYSPEDIETISVNLGNRGKIDLIGKVIRVIKDEDSWSAAIDLSNTYKLNTLRKL